VAFEGSQITRSVIRISGFRDPEFDYQLLRAIGVADYGGSTAGECLAAAAMIIDGDPTSWVRVFGELARRVEGHAVASAAAGHVVSARDHFLRASTYFRTAEYYAEADPASLSESGRRSRACFERAGALFDPPIESLEIPFEGASLPGYLVPPRVGATPSGSAVGTLVVVGGFDSTAEELYLQLGAAGAARGWQVVVFDGPGQTGCMRRNPHLTFRPDYELPIGAVLDHLQARDGIRVDRLALAGLSQGGYFAACAAAHDERVLALVADSPIVDLYRYFEAMIGPDVFRMRRDIRPADVTGIPDDLLPGLMTWGITAVCRRFGVGSLQEWKASLDRFRLGDAVGDISCPVLALVGEREGPEVLRQAGEFVARVTGPATTRRFGVDDGADAHCQVGNLRLAAQVIYDWLDEVLVDRPAHHHRAQVLDREGLTPG
jgi:pimeloyl-ACP methyl ester carboxylesterase